MSVFPKCAHQWWPSWLGTHCLRCGKLRVEPHRPHYGNMPGDEEQSQ